MTNDIATAPILTEISPLDHFLQNVDTPTAAVSCLPHQMQRKKREPLPIAQNIELLRENGRLRQEVAFYRARERSLVELFHTCVDVQQQLRQATGKFSDEASKHEGEFLAGLGVQLDRAGLGDFSVI